MTVRFGIIGTGSIADRLAEALRHTTGAKLHSVLSRKHARAEVFAAKHGASRQNAHESLDEFLADRYMDAVYIATPNGLHADQADEAAAAGKHVLVEKPLATSVADARRVVEACRQAGVVLGIGYQNRAHPCHLELRERIRKGWFGDVVSTRSRWFYRANDPSEWRLRKAEAGWWAMADVGTHAIDLLRFLFGEVEATAAVIHPARFQEAETEDSATLFLQFASGLGGVVECASCAPSSQSLVEVLGTEGYALSLETLGVAGGGKLRVAERGGNEVDWTDWPGEADLYSEQLAAFLRAILGQGEPLATGEDGLRNVEVLEAATRAAGERRLVALSEVSGG